MLAVAATDHVGGQLLAGIILVQRNERPDDHELGAVAAGQVDHCPIRRHPCVTGTDGYALRVPDRETRRPHAGTTRVLRHGPLGCPLIEVLGVVDVVRAPQLGLDPEEVLRVADVFQQRGRHLGHRREQATEGTLIGDDQRVVGLRHVERDTAAERIDHGLDRVPHVVEPVAQAAVTGQPGRIRPL